MRPMNKCEEEVYYDRMIWVLNSTVLWRNMLSGRKLMVSEQPDEPTEDKWFVSRRHMTKFMRWAREDADERLYKL